LGDGTFGVEQILPGDTHSPNDIESFEVDGDGDMDIIVSLYDADQLVWYENLGDGEFSVPILIADHYSAYDVFNADMDGDGDIDILLSSFHGNRTSWFENYNLSPYQGRGEVYIDNNENGIRDSGEVARELAKINSSPENAFAYSYASGRYFMNFDSTIEATYEVYPDELAYWNISSDSLSYTFNVDDDFTFIDSLDFGFYPDTLVDTIGVQLDGSFPRCNRQSIYWLSVNNFGTTVPSGVIHLELDELIVYDSASFIPDSIIGQNIYWAYDSLDYFDDYLINVYVQMPDFTEMGELMTSTVNVTVDSLEITDFNATLGQILACAYDPNDKMALPAGVDSLGYIAHDTEQLEYTIRFQNTGTDTAFTIRIEDQLDSMLNWTSLELLSYSHDMEVEVSPTGKIIFHFNDIMLPDSNVNEIASHGFVKYRISVLEDLDAPTSIYNTAGIYFDYNPPIITNTKINTLFDCQSILESLIGDFESCINDSINCELTFLPTSTELSWSLLGSTSEEDSFSWVSDSVGVFDLSLSISTGFCVEDTIFPITIWALPEVELSTLEDDSLCLDFGSIGLIGSPEGGTYSGAGIIGEEFHTDVAGEGTHTLLYTFEDEFGCSASDSIDVNVFDCLGVYNELIQSTSVYPNPFDDYIVIDFGEELNGDQNIIIYDLLGKEVYRNEKVIGSTVKVMKGSLGVGVYTLMLVERYDRIVVYSTKIVVD
jgi:hypothetical protein